MWGDVIYPVPSITVLKLGNGNWFMLGLYWKVGNAAWRTRFNPYGSAQTMWTSIELRAWIRNYKSPNVICQSVGSKARVCVVQPQTQSRNSEHRVAMKTTRKLALTKRHCVFYLYSKTNFCVNVEGMVCFPCLWAIITQLLMQLVANITIGFVTVVTI